MDRGRLESLLPETGAGPLQSALLGEDPQARSRQLLLFVGEAIRPGPVMAAWLAREGLRCLSLPAPEPATRAASLAHFDAVLLHAPWVRGHGARTLQAMADAHACPLLVLADEPDEIDEILALELGADAYVPWPMAPRRLRAHLLALWRRPQRGDSPPPVCPPQPAHGVAAAPAVTKSLANSAHLPLAADAASPQLGGWALDYAERRLQPLPPNTPPGRAVRLSFTHATLLRELMVAGGRVVPSDTLRAALPQAEHMAPRGLRIHMHRLRQRLREQGVRGLQLEAVRGSGYALVSG